MLLQILSIVNRASKEKELSCFLNPRIPDSLKVGLSFWEKRIVIEVVPYSAVSREDLLLGGDLIERDELRIKLYFDENRNQYFKRHVDLSLYERSHSISFSSRGEPNPIAIRSLNPLSSVDLIVVVQDILMLDLYLVDHFLVIGLYLMLFAFSLPIRVFSFHFCDEISFCQLVLFLYLFLQG